MLATLLGLFAPVATGALLEHVLPRAEQGLHHAIIAGLAAAALAAAVFTLVRDVAVVRIQGRMDGVHLAIKPHRRGQSRQPERAIWSRRWFRR